MTDQLTAIDDALETGAADHGDPLTRELQELALALRADAPEPDPEFRHELGRRVRSGFPKPATLRQPLWRRAVTPAFATGLIAVPIVVIVILAGGSGDPGLDGGGASSGSGGGGDDNASSGAPAIVAPEQRPPQSQEFQRAADQAASSSGPAVPLPPDGGFAPGQRNRKIERSVGLELEMPVDQMARVAEQVTTVTNRHGGFVLSSSVSTGEDSAGGDFELRIPAARLRPALRDLAALADVRTQSQSGRDVTREHVTARDRLQSARAERRSLLRRLELAATDEEAEAIRRRLDLVAGEINGLRAQLRGLRLRTDYAVVTVSLLPKDGNEGGGAGGSFDDALGDAGDLFVGVAGVIIRVLAVGIPLGLIALVGWLAGRAVTRRRRESALA
jgi:PPE-repeat protein